MEALRNPLPKQPPLQKSNWTSFFKKRYKLPVQAQISLGSENEQKGGKEESLKIWFLLVFKLRKPGSGV